MKLRRILALLLLSAVGLVLVAAGLLVGGWLALSQGWERERVRSAAEALLQSALADAGVRGRLRIGSISGPLYPELVLHDLRFERDGLTMARVGAAELGLDLRALYAERRLVIPKLHILGASISLAPDAQGEWPWQLQPSAEPAPEPESERPFSVELGLVQVDAADVDAVWIQADKPSHVAARFDGELQHWVLPRSGDPDWPESVRAVLDVRPGEVAGRALLGARLGARLDGSKLTLADSHLESRFGRLRLQGDTDLAGWLDPDAAASAHLVADADALDLAILLGRPELAGAVGGKAEVEATHLAGTDLGDSQARVSLALAKSSIGRLEIAGGELRGSYDRGKWTLERAVASSSAGRLTAKGSGDLERIASLDANLEVSDLAALAVIGSSPASGQASAKLALSGPWKAPTGSLELEARQLRAANLDLGTVSLRARSTGIDRYRVEPFVVDGPTVQLRSDGPILLRRFEGAVQVDRAQLRLSEREAVALTGRVSPGRLGNVRVEIARLSLARVGDWLGAQQPLGGELSGSLRADGALPRPALSGHLSWQSPKLGDMEIDSASVDLSTSGALLAADGRIVAAGQDRLRARLALPWSPRIDLGRALERPETLFELDGQDLDLAIVQEFAPSTLRRVVGAADLRLSLRGGMPEPGLSGELTISNAACDVPALAQSFGPLDARLVLDRDALRIDHFTLREGDRGLAKLSGELLLSNLRPDSADLALAIDDFPVRWQTTLQTHAFGNVRLRGPLDSLSAEGQVELRGLRYSLAGGTDPLLGEVTIRDSSLPEKRKLAGAEETSKYYDRARAQLKVLIPNDGRVQGQGANLEIAGELLASKDPGGPLRVTGAIDTQKGSYRIRGKTFIVEQAHVAFVGRPDLDPDLDVRAMHRVRDIRVYALVRGRASSPSVQLTSDPPYPQDDVLALLLFGKTRDELGQQQAGQLQSAIAGTAGAAALDSLSTRLGLDIPIDTVEVDNGQSNGQTTVGVGGYVTQDIFVRYGRGVGADSESNVQVDWRFHKPWSVETSISTRGDSSLDLIWTYDY